MKSPHLVLFVATVLALACTHPQAGSSPSVPKKAIERAADTKIADAGSTDPAAGGSTSR